MTFHEDWFSEGSQQTLAQVAASTNGLPGAVIEVGAWEGRSTTVLAVAVAPEMVRVVDTWLGNPGEPCAEAAQQRDVFATFAQNMLDLTDGNYSIYRMDWRQFFADWSWPIRFLFIDATHTYDEVADNITAALPYMVPGGVICGDDVTIPGVHDAVADLLPGFTIDRALWIWRAP